MKDIIVLGQVYYKSKFEPDWIFAFVHKKFSEAIKKKEEEGYHVIGGIVEKRRGKNRIELKARMKK